MVDAGVERDEEISWSCLARVRDDSANHVSWLDVLAISALRPSVFVCKSEIAAWPALGWLLGIMIRALRHEGWRYPAMFAISAAVVLFYGIYGYFVEAIVRIGFSVYQVIAVLACIIGVSIIDVFLVRGAESRGEIRWGMMPDRSQYALFILAVTFTWLMGLMGFARSGIRQHWHVYEVMRDTSPDAATPALGQAANMISLCVLIFLGLVAFIFWLGGLAERAGHKTATVAVVPQPATGD